MGVFRKSNQSEKIHQVPIKKYLLWFLVSDLNPTDLLQKDLQLIFWRLTKLSGHNCISYRNQSFDIQRKSDDWFLYGIQHWAEMD